MKIRPLIRRLYYYICLRFIFLHFVTANNVNSPATDAPAPLDTASHRGADSKSAEFWLTTELLSADFRKGCLSTALCHEPKFKLINTMTVNGEQAVISWPVIGAADLVQEQARSFITHWTVGEPEDVALSCKIAGTDPSFGFSRVCDETPSKRVFNDAAIQRTLNGNLHWRDENEPTTRLQRALNDRVESGAIDGRIIVELRGRCFNATLAVRKHLKRCPWCPDLNTHIVVSGQQSSDKDESASSLQQRLSNTDALFLHNLLIVALSGAIVFGLTGFCCAIFIHCRYKKRRARKGINAVTSLSAKQSAKRLLKFVPPPSEYKDYTKQQEQQHQCVLPVRASTAMSPRKIFEAGTIDLRYEAPWDKKYRGMPAQWLDATSAGGNVNGNASHYQTLTWTRSRYNNNNNCGQINNNNLPMNNSNYDVTADHGTCYEGHLGLHQHAMTMQQTSGSSIGTCNTASSGGSGSGDGSAASTSATTIGCNSSLSSGCGNCAHAAPTTVAVDHNNAIIGISSMVNHPSALFAALKQQQQTSDVGETLNRVSLPSCGANGVPHTNPYICHPAFYPTTASHEFSRAPPPNVPPPLPNGARHDDSGLDSV